METYNKNEIDLKLQLVNERMDASFNIMTQKIENMFLKEREYLDSKRKEQTRWIVGTILATIGTVAVPFILQFIGK